MCLIVESKKDIPLTKAFVTNVMEKNSDGFGLMWIQNNHIQTFKSSKSNIKKFMKKYKEIKDFNPFIHFRMKTHGEIDDVNTHPYYCGYGIWMMHNGIIHQTSHIRDDKSDTWHFINCIITPLFNRSKNPHELIRSNVFKWIVEDYIGTNNRIVFGDRGGFVIHNPEAWYTIKDEATKMKGMRVSNTYAWNEYVCKPHVPYTPPTVVYSSAHAGNTRVHDYTVHRYSSYGLEEIGVKDMWIDDQNNIWEKYFGCWKKRPDLTFEDVCNMEDDPVTVTGNVTEKKKEEKASTTVTIPSEPALHKNKAVTSKEMEQFLQLALPIQKETEVVETCPFKPDEPDEVDSLTDEEYNKELLKTWRNYGSAAIGTLVYSAPDDAARVLCALLKR